MQWPRYGLMAAAAWPCGTQRARRTGEQLACALPVDAQKTKGEVPGGRQMPKRTTPRRRLECSAHAALPWKGITPSSSVASSMTTAADSAHSSVKRW